MFVSNWMSRHVIAVEPSTKVPDAIQLMRQHRIRTVLVLEHDRLVGLVSDRDVRTALPSKATDLEAREQIKVVDDIPVSAVMTSNPLTVEPETPIEHAAFLMRRHKFGSLPVVLDGKLVGILTQSDIFEAMVELLGEQEFGTRITIDLGISATHLRTVSQILEEYAPQVISAVTYSRESLPANRGLVLKLRLGHSGAEALLHRLEQAGICVVDARLDGSKLHCKCSNVAGSSDESHQSLGNSIV